MFYILGIYVFNPQAQVVPIVKAVSPWLRTKRMTIPHCNILIQSHMLGKWQFYF